MNEKTRVGLNTLGAAALLGVWGDALLRATPWGLNMFLWTVALGVAFVWLRQRQQLPLTGTQRCLLGGLLLFAVAFVWRDSLTLRALDVLAGVLTLALLTGSAQAAFVWASGALGYVLRVFRLGLDALGGALGLIFGDIAWSDLPRGQAARHGLALLRGLALALPLLLLFGGLLASADAVFGHYVALAFQWDFGLLWSHLALTASCAWLAAGVLRGLSGHLVRPEPTGERPQKFVLGAVETATILGLLNALFLAFVLVQIRYFFGGAAHVQATLGLTYAEYARRGFFELVTVAALVLPLLLALHWGQPTGEGRREPLFRLLAGVQISLLFVIMASAVARMRLYQAEYGLTELRFYTSAFMGWLAVVLVWFALTVLRGQRPRFAGGALLAAFASVLTLHAVNPDAAIVRANVAQSEAGRPFDAAYAASLSLDALPALSDALPHLDLAVHVRLSQYLQQQRTQLAAPDWRSWSFARAQARQALRSRTSRFSGEGL